MPTEKFGSRCLGVTDTTRHGNRSYTPSRPKHVSSVFSQTGLYMR